MGVAALFLFLTFIVLDEVLQRRRCQKTYWMPPALVPLVYLFSLVPASVLYLLLRWTMLPLFLNTLGQQEMAMATP
jgi:hypothetical protein